MTLPAEASVVSIIYVVFSDRIDRDLQVLLHLEPVKTSAI
jgi:hypothetical protein